MPTDLFDKLTKRLFRIKAEKGKTVRMNTLYMDCRMGVTGVKILGALVDILENPDCFVYEFNRIGIEGISMHRMPDAIKGITGSQIEWRRVSANDEDPYGDELDYDNNTSHISLKHTRRNLNDVKAFIERLSVNGDVKKTAVRVYERIAEAAAKANNKNAESMILHRTGSRDIIASIVGVCMIINELNPDKVIASAVTVGDGYTRTPRGKMPIPTPEVQALLGDALYTQGKEEGELCSLEGAALITEIADEFGIMPEMTVTRSGAGFGHRSFKSGVNCLRVYMGDALRTSANVSLTELKAELYDITKDALALLFEKIQEIGVVSAYTYEITSIFGQKGCMLKCICENETADNAATMILNHSSAKLITRTVFNAYTN